MLMLELSLYPWIRYEPYECDQNEDRDGDPAMGERKRDGDDGVSEGLEALLGHGPSIRARLIRGAGAE